MSLSVPVIAGLVLGALFFSGWANASSAIAAAISTHVIRYRAAVVLAVACNFLGSLLIALLNTRVAETVSSLVIFNGEPGLNTVAASLVAMALWSVASWHFKVYPCMSHILIAGLSGSAVEINGLGSLNPQPWILVLAGFLLSTLGSFLLGYWLVKLLELLFRNANRTKANRLFRAGQVGGAACVALMHGAQDGQKFMGIVLLVLYGGGLLEKAPPDAFRIPFWLCALCSLVLGLGTLAGGLRLNSAAGTAHIKLDVHQGFAADAVASTSLLIATLIGAPASTIHTKITSLMGVVTARHASRVDWQQAKQVLYAWLVAFPGCALLAFLTAELFMLLFP